LKRFVFRHFQARTEQKILERMSAENPMDHYAQVVSLKINTVIAHAKPVQRSSRLFQFAELVQVRRHYLLGQSAKFAQDLQLEFLGHPREFRRTGRIENDLERSHVVISLSI
jgi:hypothetical protein